MDIPVIRDYKNLQGVLTQDQIRELAELDFEIEKAKRLKKLKDLGVDIDRTSDMETEAALLKTLTEKYGDDAFLVYYAIKSRNPAAYFLLKDLLKEGKKKGGEDLSKEEFIIIEKMIKEGKFEDAIRYLAMKKGDPSLIWLLMGEKKEEKEEDRETKDVLTTIALTAIQTAYRDLKEGKMSREEFVSYISSLLGAIAQAGKQSPIAYILPMILASAEKGEKKEDTTVVLLKALIEKLPVQQQQQLNLKDIIEGIKVFVDIVKSKPSETEAEKWLKDFAQKALFRIVEDKSTDVDKALAILDKLAALAQKAGALPTQNPEVALKMFQMQIERDLKQQELQLKKEQMQIERELKREQIEYERKKEEAWRKALSEFMYQLGIAFSGVAPQQYQQQQLPKPEIRIAKCPSCGNALEVPKGVEAIVCRHCGKRLRVIWEKPQEKQQISQPQQQVK